MLPGAEGARRRVEAFSTQNLATPAAAAQAYRTLNPGPGRKPGLPTGRHALGAVLAWLGLELRCTWIIDFTESSKFTLK